MILGAKYIQVGDGISKLVRQATSGLEATTGLHFNDHSFSRSATFLLLSVT